METEKSIPLVPPQSVALDATEQSAKVVELATAEEDKVADLNQKPQTNANEKKKPQASIGNYFRVLAYGTKLDAFLMILSCVTSIASGAAMPLMNVVFGDLVNVFADYFVPNTTVTKQQFQAEVNKNALYLVYIFIAKFALSYISMFTIRISGLRISAALRLAYLRATFAQPVSTIDTISPGKVSTRITTSASTIQLAISQHFALLFQSLSLTIGLYIVSFAKSWLLTFVASASIPFIFIIYSVTLPPFIKIHKVTETFHEEASALAYEIFSSIRIVAAFGAEDKLAEKHADLLDKAAKNERKAAPLVGLMMAPMMFAVYGTFGLTFWFGIRQYTRGHIQDVGTITVVLFSIMMAVMSISRVATPIIFIAKAATAATELFVTIDAETPDISGFKDPDVSSEADIRMADVSFSYPSRPNVQILNGLNVEFGAGKITAIVGPSGSGKSTVVSLLQRWYDLLGTIANATTTDTTGDKEVVEEKPKKKTWKKSDKSEDTAEKTELGPHTCTGSVTIGGVDLRDVDLKWWRAQIGLVQQEPFLFNDTIYNNVAFGLCGTPMDDATEKEKMALVEDACKEAYADEFISKLPQGYQTLVGESGIKLSGGQRQRIAIARSIIKKPPILILDEATSAIDVRTERIVQEALDRVSRNRTTIVIAHRLSTIKRADKIVVLRNGKLVEQGTHDELLGMENGIYYGLVHAQELALEADEATDADGATMQKVKTAGTEHSTTDQNHEDRGSPDEPQYKPHGLINSVGRLLAEQRHHWVLYSVATLGILGAGAVYPIQAWIFAKVIEVFTYTGPKFVEEGNFWSAMFAAEAAGVGVAYFVLNFCGHLISVVIPRYYRQEYLVNVLRKRIPFFDSEGYSAGSLTSRLSVDTTQLQQLLGSEMSMALVGVVNLIGSIIISFVYGWKLSLVGLCCALPPILVAGYLRIALETKFEAMNNKVFENSAQFATEAVGAFRTVVSLGMEEMIADRYHQLMRKHVKDAYLSARYSTLVFAASDSVELACSALAFWYGGTLLASREYFVTDFFVIYMAIIQGAMAAGMWFSIAPNLASATSAANRIMEMRPQNTNSTKHDPLPDTSNGVGIEFRNVSFSYKSRDVPVLSNLNLKILPGQFAALVGASGCGKSTTISLLERFYDATSGSVLYNGQDITTLDIAEYRKTLSLVSQEPTLYEGTIRDNVALSVEEATDEDVHQACLDAQIHDFITSLPDGYATRLGPKGLSLSGGQKQRLSLARALLRKPKLLLLDEATSSLDSESEKLVQEAIERAAGEGKRTVIAVAHRLATIQKADVIFVVGSGRVLERGGHGELLRGRGVYWQMCQAQALDR